MISPKVSIIMGAYNCENIVSKSIESVIDQSYENWELIICDDASTDKTYNVINKYAKLDSRIKLIRNKTNKRLAQSLNNCLEIANGKYIARIDADDYYTKDKLNVQVKYMEENPELDVTGTGRYLYNDEEGDYAIVKPIENPSKKTLLTGSPFAHPTIMMKKEVYDSIGGYTVSKATMRCEDLDLWFKFYEKDYIGKNIQKPLLHYHLCEDDYKKRTVKAAVGTSKIMYSGFKRIGVPWYKYILIIRPILSSIVPHKLLYKYHKNKYINMMNCK